MASGSANPQEQNGSLGEVSTSKPPPLSEKEILQTLDKIHERMDKTSALVFRYRLHALLPENTKGIWKDDEFTIKDGYVLLRQHKEYYRFALSLIIFMIDEGFASKEELEKLKIHATCHKVYETDIINQHLNLWTILTDIATEFNKSESSVRSFVNYVSGELAINTDHIKINDRFSLASALNAFRLVEEKGKLKPMLVNHAPELRRGLYLYQLLRGCSFNKLISKYVDSFNPDQPLTVALLEGESKHTETMLYIKLETLCLKELPSGLPPKVA